MYDRWELFGILGATLIAGLILAFSDLPEFIESLQGPTRKGPGGPWDRRTDPA